MKRIFWAGDSTAKFNDHSTYPQAGIGQAFELFIKSDTQILNYAEDGLSTKSFINNQRLVSIDSLIVPNDFLFIQFGHNDEKLDDPFCGTEPYGDFQDNLMTMIETAADHGAYPVLITPLYRRKFDEYGNLTDEAHKEYANAMRVLAYREGLPCIDLCRFSYELLKKVGDSASKRWFMNFSAGMYSNYPDGLEDNTHLRFDGAMVFAEYIAFELGMLGGAYAELLK